MCKPVLNFLCPFPFLVLFCHCEGVKRLKQSPLIFFIVLVLFCHCALLLFFSVLAQSFPWQSQKATASQRRLAVTKRGGSVLAQSFPWQSQKARLLRKDGSQWHSFFSVILSEAKNLAFQGEILRKDGSGWHRGKTAQDDRRKGQLRKTERRIVIRQS